MLQHLAASRWFSEISKKPLQVLIGLCLFATAASGGALGSVASTSMAVLFVACIFYIQRWPDFWRGLARDEQLLLIGLALYALSGLVSYYNVNDQQEFVKHMGRYIRFLLVIPVYLLLSRSGASLFKYLLAGSIISGPLYLTMALISVTENPGLPAAGHYHHITFGDAAMLNVVFLSAMLVSWQMQLAMKVIVAISIVCALYASFLSQARGAWLALPFCGILLFYLAIKVNKLNIKIVIPVLLLGVVAIAVSPAGNVIESRVKEATHEIGFFISGEKVDLSIGGRLAMWDIALDVWQEHPIIGTGLGDFDQEIELRQSQGIYETIAVHASVHNIYLQALATTGSIGFLILCFSLVIQPIRIFYHPFSESLNPAKLAGLMVIVAYAVFGLTESWILRAPVVSMYLIYLMTLTVAASRDSSTENTSVH